MISISHKSAENDERPIFLLDKDGSRILFANHAGCGSVLLSCEALLAMEPNEYPALVRRIIATSRTRRPSDSGIYVWHVTFQGAEALMLMFEGSKLLEEIDCFPGLASPKELSEPITSALDTNSRLSSRLRQTQSLAKAGHWEMDIASQTICLSHKSCEIFDLVPQSSSRDCESLNALIDPADRHVRNEKIAQVVKSGGAYTCQYRIICGNGVVKYVVETGETVNDDKSLVWGITQDITEFALARSEIEKTANMIEDAEAIAQVGSWEYNPETGVVSRSPMLAKIVGTPDTQEIPLSDARLLYLPKYRVRHKQVWDACLRSGTPFDEVMEMKSVTGEHKWVRFCGAPVWNDARTKVIALRGALQDVSEVVLARQAREEISRELEETLEAITDGFMVINRDWIVTFANTVAEDLMGISRERMLGQHLWTLFPEAKDGEFHRRYQQIMSDRKTQRFVAKSIRSGKWLAISAYPTTQGLAISARDVSAEHARDEQMRLLETAVSRLKDIVMISDARTLDQGLPTFVFVNAASERVLGYKSQEILGKSATLLRGTDTQKEEIAQLQKALEQKTEARVEIINYTKSGRKVWLDLNVVPMWNENGAVTHWVSVARDITERKLNEQRVALSEERFRLVAGATNDVIWDCDLSSGQMWWNDNLLTVFGHDPNKFEDKITWWDSNIHPEERQDVLQRMQAVIDGRDEFWELKYRFQRSDGSYAHVRDHGAILRDENGTATRILGNMTDVSEQQRLEEQLLQSQKLEAIGKLTGGVAHDFNNLLAVIMGNLELLRVETARNGAMPTDADDLIQSGIDAVKRGSELTRQMLSYARKATLTPVPTNLNDTVRETESWVRRTIDSSIVIKTQLEPSLRKTLLDISSLQNSLVNLLLNARDAITGSGTIVIETRNLQPDDPLVIANDLPRTPNGYVMLSVCDNGVGIEQSDLDQVCDPFFTTKPVGQGSGLGLSMVQGFVRQSGGDIRIFSEHGLGTTVTLFFSAVMPLSDAGKDPAKRVPAHALKVDAGRNGSILLAEDEPDVRTMLKRTLRNAGYEVTETENGDAALRTFTQNSEFDLLLTDISMPGRVNGQALAEACWSIRPKLPVLFLTGHAPETLDSTSISHRNATRLMKPLSRGALLKAVEALVPSKG